MRQIVLLVCVCAWALVGCTQQYVMKLSNGTRITAASRPKLVNGFYVYKDATGQLAPPVSQARVMEIEPSSMASEEKSKIKITGSK